MENSAHSTFSAEWAASHTPSKDSVQRELFAPLHSANRTDSAKPSSESTGPTSRFTTTYENLKETRNPPLQMELTSSAAGSRDCASLGVKPGSSEAQKMTEISGRKCCELLKLYKVDGLLGRMSKALLTSQWASSAAFLTWKASDINASPFFCLHVQKARSTEEIAFGSLLQMWPTPQHRDWKSGQAERYTNKKHSNDLNDAVRMWPTPRASEHKDTGPVGSKSHTHMLEKKYLCAEVKDPHQPSGQLNPTWVEWLMGFPTGHTELKPLEMPSSRRSSSKSDGQSSKVKDSDE